MLLKKSTLLKNITFFIIITSIKICLDWIECDGTGTDEPCRLDAVVEDLKLDVPNAVERMEGLRLMAKEEGIHNPDA